MATHLEEHIAKAGLGRVQIEGAGGSDWVLIDVGDVVVTSSSPKPARFTAWKGCGVPTSTSPTPAR